MINWEDIVQPSTVSVILGKKGSGKSGLAYFLTDYLSLKFSLVPLIVGFPQSKKHLLPPNYEIKDIGEALTIENAIIIIDEGTTMLPAGQRKLEELVKAFIALSRQRNQIVLFIFHSSSDVGARILRGVDNVLIKEPSRRQIHFGSKDSWFKSVLTDAKERFTIIKKCGDNPKEHVYIDAEDPDFRGMLKNTLPAFWSKDLSTAWAGVVFGGILEQKPAQEGIVMGKTKIDITEDLPPGYTTVRKGKRLMVVREGSKEEAELKEQLAEKEGVTKVMIENGQRRKVVDAAIEQGWVINPSKGMEYYVQTFLKLGYCPCDNNRTNCPCPQAITEVTGDGYCKCRLYWLDLQTFRDTLTAGQKPKK